MEKYNITFEETVTQSFVIQANSLDEALEIGKNGYHDGKFVLEPGNIICTRISAECPKTRESIDWHEI